MSLTEVTRTPSHILRPCFLWLEGVPGMETPPLQTLPTIIVVEDNPVDVYLIRWVLKAHELSHALEVIDSGDRAMDYVNQLAHEERRRSPTLMLLDLHLPQRDGREILQRVKALPQGSDIRVVVVTSSNNPTDRRETLAMGADAYFTKPYHLNEFMALGNLIKNLAFGNPPSFMQNN